MGRVLGLALVLLQTPAPAPVAPRGIAARYPGDGGIAHDPAVLFASGFEQGFEGWTSVNTRIASIQREEARAHSGTAFARLTATRGVDTGGEVALRLREGVDRLHLRFACRFDRDTCWPHHFVKLRALKPLFRGHAGVAPPGDQGFWTGIEPLRGTWRFYTYWHAMRGWNNPGDQAVNDDGTPNTGQQDFYGNSFTPDGQSPVPRDAWICVEVMLQANTPGRSDGEQAFWIDGREVGRYAPGVPVGTWQRNVFVTSGPRNTRPTPFEGFDFRTDPGLKINEIALHWYVSKEYAALGTSDRNVVDFDDVVVATEYIGPRTPGQDPRGSGGSR
ncbi:MAG: hypothetical protein JNK02_02945 [Planctomycetes bacterium]|nr:hypothetical protein [Planctomycetota bacterium]